MLKRAFAKNSISTDEAAEELNLIGWAYWTEYRRQYRELHYKPTPMFSMYKPGWRLTPNPPYIEHEYAERLESIVAKVCNGDEDSRNALLLKYAYNMGYDSISGEFKKHGVETNKYQVIRLIDKLVSRIHSKMF